MPMPLPTAPFGQQVRWLNRIVRISPLVGSTWRSAHVRRELPRAQTPLAGSTRSVWPKEETGICSVTWPTEGSRRARTLVCPGVFVFTLYVPIQYEPKPAAQFAEVKVVALSAMSVATGV